MQARSPRTSPQSRPPVLRDIETLTVRPAVAADVPFAATTLARAFYDDPVARWINRRDDRRLQQLRTFYEVALTQLFLRHEQTYVCGGGIAVAVWTPPGKWEPAPSEVLGISGKLLRTMGTEVLRGLRVIRTLEKKHPRKPHMYLAFLGTDPDHQGRGLGTKLLRQVLVRCDAEGLPAYLEASSEDNRRLYLRHGFSITEEIRLTGGGPPMWLMWRDPRA